MALYPVNEIRFQIIALVLVGADIFILLPAFANPFRLLYVYILTPPVVFKFVGDMDCYQSSETTVTIHSISRSIWRHMFSRIIGYNAKICL